MKMNVTFQETDQSFKPDFGEVHNISDGGYERGYAAGHEVGSTEGYAQGHAEGYDSGYEQGEALLIQGKPARIENAVATSVRDGAFSSGAIGAPVYVYFKNAKSIGTSGFQNCRSLNEAYFDSVTSIGNNAFYLCQVLKTLVIRTPSVCKLSAAMTNNAIASKTGYIYVPAALVEQYKAAANWSTHASQFRALEDYTVDGTITGALDESKI